MQIVYLLMVFYNPHIHQPGSPSTYPKRMSIGTKQGFSIVQFVGTGNAETIPHGLSESPTFIIHKFATASSNWSIWTPHLSSNTRLTFTSNGTDSSTSFQNTNSSTFNVASGFNDNNVEMIFTAGTMSLVCLRREHTKIMQVRMDLSLN